MSAPAPKPPDVAFHYAKAANTLTIYSDNLFPPQDKVMTNEDWAITLRFYETLHWVVAFVRTVLQVGPITKHKDLEDLLDKEGDKIGLSKDFRTNYDALQFLSRECRYRDPKRYQKLENGYADRLDWANTLRNEILNHPKIKAHREAVAAGQGAKGAKGS